MATLWITYAWDDNVDGDVDFFASQLIEAGLEVKLDRWKLGAGKRLWEQLDEVITSSSECDAWMIFATHNSLASEPCQEELAYALDRALRARGEAFPLLALFPGPVASELLPAAIRTRLYVSATDADWRERIVAATEQRQPRIAIQNQQPFLLKVHDPVGQGNRIAIELRPRAEVWGPILVGIPAEEKASVNPMAMMGPKGHPTDSGMWSGGEGTTPDGKLYAIHGNHQATPIESLYLWCDTLPSQIVFGRNGGAPQYTVQLQSPTSPHGGNTASE